MCTIPDLGAALAELRRVLCPGGTLHFVEHWQRRLEPLQMRVTDSFYEEGAPRFFAALSLGVAVNPSAVSGPSA
ncbi:class I SAM-dependent methyltransferase [Mumia zhuanghuii]|uniref:class I SAM-dependent methyltransferase n=1 Tax=Mumia zhuanghuii TaxID=2585211 RepID=UPI001E64A223|nr:class I SAM-dependent methyltransferase [Mumia zhuanghuii]